MLCCNEITLNWNSSSTIGCLRFHIPYQEFCLLPTLIYRNEREELSTIPLTNSFTHSPTHLPIHILKPMMRISLANSKRLLFLYSSGGYPNTRTNQHTRHDFPIIYSFYAFSKWSIQNAYCFMFYGLPPSLVKT